MIKDELTPSIPSNNGNWDEKLIRFEEFSDDGISSEGPNQSNRHSIMWTIGCCISIEFSVVSTGWSGVGQNGRCAEGELSTVSVDVKLA